MLNENEKMLINATKGTLLQKFGDKQNEEHIIKVYRLAACLLEEILKDENVAKKDILISSDDEGNEYHSLFYTLTTDVKDIEEMKKFSNGFHDDNDPKDVVVLG